MGWQDRVRVLHVEQSIDSTALAQHRALGLEDAIRAQAARALSDKLIREGAIEDSVEAPDPDPPWRGRTTYKYDVAVVMPEDGRSHFAEQLATERESGRVDGILEAAAAVEKTAATMRGIDRLIAFNLEAAARDLRELAQKAPQRTKQ